MSENCRKSAKTTEASNLRAAFFAPGIWIWLRRQVRKLPAFFAPSTKIMTVLAGAKNAGRFRTYDVAKTAAFALFGSFRTFLGDTSCSR